MTNLVQGKIMYRIDESYYLRPLSADDMGGPYTSWFIDQNICRFSSHGKFTKSTSDFVEYINSSNSEKLIVLAICHNEDGHVGNISLQNISLINRNAEFAIIIGDSKHHGKGVAFKASQILLTHGFNKLNLHRVYCGTAEGNIGMVQLAKKLGMKQEGCQRKHLFLEGEWIDKVEFGILKHEFLCQAKGLFRS